MREIIKYYNNTSEKDETKIYYLDKKVSTPDTLFLYYKSKEKTKDEIEKEELKKEIKTLKEELISKTNNLKEELNAAQEAIDFLIQIGSEV